MRIVGIKLLRIVTLYQQATVATQGPSIMEVLITTCLQRASCPLSKVSAVENHCMCLDCQSLLFSYTHLFCSCAGLVYFFVGPSLMKLGLKCFTMIYMYYFMMQELKEAAC